MKNSSKTIKVQTRTKINHLNQFFDQIQKEIETHDNNTGYNISDDMLIPYINKLAQSYTNLSDKQIEIIKSILINNRILLYYDQYLNLHDKIINSKPNKNNLKIKSEKDLLQHFFELPILLDVFRQLQNPRDFNINNIINLYYQAIWNKINPIQDQLNIEYNRMADMEPRMLFIHGIERTNMFIVPNDVIICKVVSYNYTGAFDYSFLNQLKNVISYYKNNNILNSSCCAKDGAISIFLPNQLCNDTDFDIYKFQIFNFKLLKNYMGLFSINEKNKLVNHKLSNYDFKNMFMKRIKLSNLIRDTEVKNKILIILCCRNQEIGTLAAYTEFNYRLERLQLLISRTYCTCSNLEQIKYELPSVLLKYFYKKRKKELPFIWDHNNKYQPFYDTYLSTDIGKTFPNPKAINKSLKLADIIANNNILKSLPIYKKVNLFVKIYQSYSDDHITTPQILDALAILLLNLINNSYKFRWFKFEADDRIITKSKFYYKLLDTLHANNTLNIIKCSELLKLILSQLQIFLLQSYKLLANHPGTIKSRQFRKLSVHNSSVKRTIIKNNNKQSEKNKNSKSRKNTTARLVSEKQHLIEYTIKLLDLYYKLSNRFGRKIKKTIIKIINQYEFRLVITQLINQPKSDNNVMIISHNEITRMVNYLYKLCNGCLDKIPSTADY